MLNYEYDVVYEIPEPQFRGENKLLRWARGILPRVPKIPHSIVYIRMIRSGLFYEIIHTIQKKRCVLGRERVCVRLLITVVVSLLTLAYLIWSTVSVLGSISMDGNLPPAPASTFVVGISSTPQV
jgi:hypothetical protein